MNASNSTNLAMPIYRNMHEKRKVLAEQTSEGKKYNRQQDQNNQRCNTQGHITH